MMSQPVESPQNEPWMAVPIHCGRQGTHLIIEHGACSLRLLDYLDTTLVYEELYTILADTVGVVLLGSTNHSGW